MFEWPIRNNNNNFQFMAGRVKKRGEAGRRRGQTAALEPVIRGVRFFTDAKLSLEAWR